MSFTAWEAPLSRRTVATLTGVGLLALGLIACDDSSSAESGSGAVDVVASTNVYGDIASSVGGDLVHVTAFISSPDQDPHSYESSGRDVLAVSTADLVIENGGGYDDFMDRLLDSAGGDAKVLNVVDESGVEDSATGRFNEHVWYDLPLIQQTADAIAADLGAIDPKHRSDFRANADAFKAAVQRLIDREGDLRRRLSGTGVAVTEPVPGYMLDALGLVDETPPAFSEAVEEGDDVAVSVLAETLDLFKRHEVAALVYNDQTTGAVTDQVEQAAEDAGIPVVPVTELVPAGDSYVSWMQSNLDHLAAAIG